MNRSLARVLRVHNRYQECGGEDVAYEAETALLAAHGHDVDTLEFSNDDIADQRSVVDSARLALTTVWSRAGRDRIREAIHAFQPDVVHFDNTFPLVSPAAYAVGRSAGVAVVQSLHNYRLLCPSATFFRDGHLCEDCMGKTPPLPAVIHGCYRQSKTQSAVVAAMLTTHRLRHTWSRDVDRYIALTQFSKQKFLAGGLPAERIAVKPHFLDPDPGEPMAKSDSMLFVGRLADYKGVMVLPLAWNLLENDMGLRIAGDGPLANALGHYAERDPRIRLLGRQTKHEVMAEMKTARAVIVPSLLYETFGLIIVEAFACDTPVIASRLGAMAELIDHGRTGLLFTPGQPDDLAAKVRWAVEHPEEMDEMGVNARNEYEAKYTAERNYPLLIDVYQQAIDHSRRARSQPED